MSYRFVQQQNARNIAKALQWNEDRDVEVMILEAWCWLNQTCFDWCEI